MVLARTGGERAPTVSVVIPVHNGARFIGAAIERLDAGVRRERRRWWTGLHAVLAGSYLEVRPALRHGLRAMRLDPARAPRLLCRAAGALLRRGRSTAGTRAGTEAGSLPRRPAGA
jgi:hypothetical protein